MTIKQQGGVFGRNPTFNNVTAEGSTSLDGPVVINQSGADVDFRVEGDTQQNALFVDGTNGHVGIGIANPPFNLVVSNGGAEGLEIGPGYLGGRTLFQNYNRSTSAYVAAWEFASEYVWNIGGTEKMRLNTSGNLAFASGNGIDFSATSGTGTSELFDDYEEGTWTPVPTATTPGITPPTFSSVSGTYTKIGRQVYITFDIVFNINGTGVGSLKLEGLPFTLAQRGFGVGVESDVVGFPIYANAIALTTFAFVETFTQAYPGGNAYRLQGNITYNV
jgi:hypothetical protein